MNGQRGQARSGIGAPFLVNDSVVKSIFEQMIVENFNVGAAINGREVLSRWGRWFHVL